MTEARTFDGRVGLQQRVLPSYRVAFFDRLARACRGGLEVFAGEPRSDEEILTGRELQRANRVMADNRELFGGAFYLCRQPGLGDWVEQLAPEVLVLEANPRYLDNWTTGGQAGRQGIGLLGWGLGAPAVHSSFAGWGRWLWSRFLRRFDGLIAYSSRGAEQFAAAGFPRERIWVAVNAVVDGPAEPAGREPLPGRRLRVLFVGRLQERKRVDVLLAAAAEMGEDVSLRIVGDGPAHRQLKKRAQQLPVPVNFAGVQQGDELAKSYRWADLFALPGTGGLAVQQAMAHGLPVVVGEGDGTQEDLVRPENGWLVPTGEPSALAAVFREAMVDPAGLRRRGQASRKLVEEEVNLEAMVGTFVTAMRHVSRSG